MNWLPWLVTSSNCTGRKLCSKTYTAVPQHKRYLRKKSVGFRLVPCDRHGHEKETPKPKANEMQAVDSASDLQLHSQSAGSSTGPRDWRRGGRAHLHTLESRAHAALRAVDP